MLMGGLSMVALFRGREINIRRLMSISVILMLIINPYFLVYDTGFLLSYSALIGIVYFDTLKKEKNENVDPGQIPATKLNTGMRGRNDGRVRK
jgi:predicted membrane metal-binding protein